MKLFAALLLMVWAGTPVSPEIRYLRFQRPIENPSAEARQTCVAIDPQIFAQSAPQLADLRLYQSTTETPYVIHVAAPASDARQQVPLLNLGQLKERTVFDAAMPAGTYGDVELSIGGHDFLATVIVTGRQTQTGAPETKLGSYTIFDLTRQRLGRSTMLHLPVSNFRYLHFEIDGAVGPDLVKGLSVLGVAASEPKYIAVATTSTVKQQGHQTLIEITLPAHTPVDRIHFAPGALPANFSRSVEILVTPVFSSKPGSVQVVQTWTARGNLLRVHRVEDGYAINEEHLNVPAPHNVIDGATRWTITIDNGDDAPIALQSVRLEMIKRDLCFDAAAGARYTLYYGDEALSAPRYDYASLFKLQSDAVQASLGPEAANPQYASRPDTRPFTERHPILLWVALGVVIVLLGTITLRTAKSSAASDHS